MLELKGITKKYHVFPAVNNVSFVVKPSDILGYLGPNGAGKTTTLKILAGLLEQTEGKIYFQDKNIKGNLYEFKKRIGYVPEQSEIYPHLSAYDYLLMVGRLRHIPEKVLKEKIEQFMELFNLSADMHSSISSYSKGMIQKVIGILAILAIFSAHLSNVVLFKYAFMPDEGISWVEKCYLMSFFFLWGWNVSLYHCLYGLFASFLLMEILFQNYRKIPFACSYLPGKAKLHVLWIFYFLSFLVYVFLLSSIEYKLLEKSSNFLVFYGIVFGALLASKIYQNYFLYRRIKILYEEKPEPVMVTLIPYDLL